MRKSESQKNLNHFYLMCLYGCNDFFFFFSFFSNLEIGKGEMDLVNVICNILDIKQNILAIKRNILD